MGSEDVEKDQIGMGFALVERMGAEWKLDKMCILEKMKLTWKSTRVTLILAANTASPS